MNLRGKLIRLAHENPEFRAELLPLLKTGGSWRNYGQLARRTAIKAVLQMMETMLPQSLHFVPASDPLYEAIRAKWARKGRSYKDKGIEGLLVQHRGRLMFIGKIGGQEMVLKQQDFPVGKV